MKRIERVCVVGLGYIGLPTATVFADHGVEVVGVDTNPAIVESINMGRPHISEPDLDVLVRRVVGAGRLVARTAPVAADAFVIAVPTPFREDRQPDISYIEAACRAVAPVLAPGNLVVLESTSPVGTTEWMSRQLAELRPDLSWPHADGDGADIRIAHCPERVLPGQILREVVQNARIIGGLTRSCGQAALALYRLFAVGDCHLTSARTAELAKLAENAFRDVNIAFANELSIICDGLGIDVWDLIRVANLHPRVNILHPGPGVGGHCIAVDPWFIVAADPANSRLIRTAREVNDSKPEWVVEKVRAAAAASTKPRPVIACLGLTYKADIDDLRESPAVAIVERLAREGLGDLRIVEPYVDALPPMLAGLGLSLEGFDRAIEAADIVLLLVDHSVFRRVDRRVLAGRRVIDTRGIW